MPAKAKKVTGRTEPRLFTPPLRKLTPSTSRGFAVIAFAEKIGVDLLPWQRWFFIHALELKPGGKEFRFDTLLLMVARQSGKTTVARLLTLWLMSTRPGTQVLGTSTAVELAREPWGRVVEDAVALGLIDNERKQVKRGAVDTSLRLNNGSRYKVSSATRRGGRSLSIDLLLVDELREQTDDWDAWNALTGTTTARPDALVLAMSNAGDDRSVVLNGVRASAMAGDNEALGIFEWSAPDDCELEDLEATAQANPALGFLISLDTLESKRKTMPPSGYRTEHLCQRVENLDPAIDKAAWTEAEDATAMSPELRKRVALVVDVSLDMGHVSLVAASSLKDGRVKVEVVAAWESTEQAVAELPDLLQRVKPKARGFFAGGPSDAIRTDLEKLGFVPIKDAPAVCQGFSEFVSSRRLLHSVDPLLTAQALGVSKANSGDGWRFTRRGVGNADAVYAAAGAVHLARTRLPASQPVRMLLPS